MMSAETARIKAHVAARKIVTDAIRDAVDRGQFSVTLDCMVVNTMRDELKEAGYRVEAWGPALLVILWSDGAKSLGGK